MLPQPGGTRPGCPSCGQSAELTCQTPPCLVFGLAEGKRKLFWVAAACTFALDQLTKALLWHHPGEGRPAIELIPHVLRIISHAGNVRGALGLGPEQPLFYVAAAVVGIAGVVLLFCHTEQHRALVHAALGMLAGGAAGNMLDRVRLSIVRDFVDLHGGDALHWHTFNLADAAICVGFVLVFYDAFFGKGRKAGSQGPATRSGPRRGA